jgi:histone-arginine methyltransferase CARM1
MSESELYDIGIPLALTVTAPTTVHGIATWFDVLFNGSVTQRWLSTAPGLPTTHWCVLGVSGCGLPAAVRSIRTAQPPVSAFTPKRTLPHHPANQQTLNPHRFQLRCVLAQPLVVLAPNTVLRGSLSLVAHERQSYTVHVTLTAPPLQPGGPPQQSSGRYDLKEPYYRQLTNWAAYQQQGQAGAEGGAYGGHEQQGGEQGAYGGYGGYQQQWPV